MSEHSAEHTPEPWILLEWAADELHISTVDRENAERVSVASIRIGYLGYIENEQQANARRIVAAVNACQGLTTEALAQSVVAKMREALEAARKILLKAIKASVELPDFDPTEHRIVKQIDAALALSRSEPEDRGTV